MDVCINIFGIDNSGIITNNIDLLLQFIQKTMHENERSEQREIFREPLNEIFYNSRLSLIEKFEILAKIYLDNLKIRGMDILKVGFNEEKQKVIIEIPITKYNCDDDEELIDRALLFSRYAIIARSIFLDLFPEFTVQELDQSKKVNFRALYKGSDLHDWINEKSGLLDLLNDSKYYLKNSLIKFHIDFDKKKEIDELSLGEIFPSKKR